MQTLCTSHLHPKYNVHAKQGLVLFIYSCLYSSLIATTRQLGYLCCKFADFLQTNNENYIDKNVALGVTIMCWVVSCKDTLHCGKYIEKQS